ncbi:hypothetical protein KR009_006378, partial [Drosophila setifemur]
MVDFMRKNPDLAKGYIKGDRAANDAKWAKLRNTLNAVGPPFKNISGWKKASKNIDRKLYKIITKYYKIVRMLEVNVYNIYIFVLKVWSDWKITIRRKLVKNQEGGPMVHQTICSNEEAVAIICDMYRTLSSISLPSIPKNAKDKPKPEVKIKRLHTEEDKEEEEEQLVPKKKHSRSNTPRNSSTDCQNYSFSSLDPMSEMVKTLQRMSSQQEDHFRRMEAIEMQKLDVAKEIAD